MPAVINVHSAEDPRDVVHRAVQALAEGKLVVFPTETVYVAAANALHAPSVEQLAKVRPIEGMRGLALAVKSADAAWDYAPSMSPLARRLARRCWPGPMTLLVNGQHSDSLTKRFPDSVQRLIAPQGQVALRVPAHQLILAALRLTVGPLAVASIGAPDQPAAVSVEEVIARAGDQVALVLDDGRTRFAQPATAVHVDGKEFQIVRPGVLNEQTLKRLASYMMLFVCTGNTCRSPMAESLARKRVADRLQCSPQEIEDRGVCVLSAGIAAMAGGRATAEAHDAVHAMGGDLTQHESQPVSDRLVRFADLILTMTRGHREALIGQWPDAADRTRLLHRGNGDVSDPIGGPAEVYRRCAEQIDSQLERWMGEIDWTDLPQFRSQPSAA